MSLRILLQLAVPLLINKPIPDKHEIRDSSVNYIVLHYDEGGDYKIARVTLIKRHASYHYFVKRDGTIIKLLDPMYAGSHAGLSYYNGNFHINKYSIGICLENKPPQEYTRKQYTSTAWLIKSLQQRYRDSTSHIILGHSEVAWPRGRKQDPGKQFNWNTLHQLIDSTTVRKHNESKHPKVPIVPKHKKKRKNPH
jgi:N-acetyl-anhydromuramyl-L-alanine amidase AmpD